MFKRAHLGLYIAIFFCYPISSVEAAMNKCTDGKQITYTTEPCEKAGLNSAGPIKDAVTVMPLIPKTQDGPSEKSGKDNGGGNGIFRNDNSGADTHREVTIKPVNPLVNKMLE